METNLFNGNDFLLTIFNATPHPMLVVDSDVKILFYNQSTLNLIADSNTKITKKRAGEIFHCIRSIEKGCGRSNFCKDCIIRNSVQESISGVKVLRKQTTLTFINNDKETEAFLLITTAPFDYNGEKFVILTIEDISELIQLKSIIPICAKCKKIRNDKNYWENVESYISKYLDISFTHSICPDCMKELYPEIAEKMNAK
ncbi:MAG: hypothetical protein ACPL7B_00065 [Candidatus Poribacteria bacterium]